MNGRQTVIVERSYMWDGNEHLWHKGEQRHGTTYARKTNISCASRNHLPSSVFYLRMEEAFVMKAEPT
jgi:hypothetical protein